MNGMPRFSFDQWVSWVINPVGFLAVVVAFLVMPCASVSVTDWSPILLGDTAPFKAVTEGSATGGNIAFHQSGYSWPGMLRAGTIVTVLVMAAGAGTGLVRPAEKRLRRAAQVAAVAGVFLVLAVLSAAQRMDENTYVTLANLLSRRTADGFDIAAGPEAGFWVSLTGLALIFAINLFARRTLLRRG